MTEQILVPLPLPPLPGNLIPPRLSRGEPASPALAKQVHKGGALFFSLFFFFVFLGPNLWHLEVPKPGLKSEL